MNLSCIISCTSPALGHDRPRAWPGWGNLLGNCNGKGCERCSVLLQQTSLEFVACNHLRNSFRCPRKNNVTGLERYVAGEISDQFRDGKKQVGEVAFLSQLSVDLEDNREG